ncbi:DDB1- and CUL4-associated factor 5-like [Tachypleus tridentatus]|uniref:DDB1- and CUL4-associated factor 5-like n=1 Tax=Tachypleus tridentatus TaxID=6853 RepID=UPI003FD574EC
MERKNFIFEYLTQRQFNGSHVTAAVPVLRQRFATASNLYTRDLFAHYGCVNAIEFSHDGEWLASGGDDRRVLLWNVERTMTGKNKPEAMKAEHNSNIFCLCFDIKHTKLFSAGNDEQVVVHDPHTGTALDIFSHEDAVYGISVEPTNDCVFATACNDGRILIWDSREPSSSDPFMVAGYMSAFHAVMYNPVEPRLLATANSKEGVGLWDVRKPRVVLLQYGGKLCAQGAMSVRFNSSGSQLIALRRRLPPVLYNVHSSYPVAEFDHPGYYNSCTMKSCSFGGDSDQYVLSGSDDFRLYVWKVPDSTGHNKSLWNNKAHMVLRGHRSIVNQVRYNTMRSLVVSSGVEKVIKLWGMFPLPDWSGSLNRSGNTEFRKVYSREDYNNLALESGQFMTHDYSHHSVKEDPLMIAFFDSLVQQDIESCSSESNDQLTNIELLPAGLEDQSNVLNFESSGSLSSSLSSSSDEEKQKSHKRDGSFSPHNNFYLSTLASRIKGNQILLDDDKEEQKSKDFDAVSDPISELIARKRHRQILQTARSSLRRTTKMARKIKEDEKLSTASNVLKSQQNFIRTCRARDSDLQDEQKLSGKSDNRKILRKKRARILQDLSDSVSSSDSEEGRIPNNGSLSNNTFNGSIQQPVYSENLRAIEVRNVLPQTSYSMQNNCVVSSCSVSENKFSEEPSVSKLVSDMETSGCSSKYCLEMSSSKTNSSLCCFQNNTLLAEMPLQEHGKSPSNQESTNCDLQQSVAFKRIHQKAHLSRKYRSRQSQEDENGE